MMTQLENKRFGPNPGGTYQHKISENMNTTGTVISGRQI